MAFWGHLMRGMLIWAVAALFVAGCTSSETRLPDEVSVDTPPAGSTESPANLTKPEDLPDPWSRIIDWQGCAEYASTSYTSSDIRQGSLPENYAASGPISDLMLVAYACESVVIDNLTVVPPIEAAYLLTSVIVDPSVEQTNTHEFYMFGMWSTNSSLVSHHHSVGVERAFFAEEIEVPSGEADLELRIVVDGRPVIEVVGAPHTGYATPTSWSAQDRLFFGDGNYTWLDARHNFTAQVQPPLRPVAITYHDAWIQEITGAPSATVNGDASILKASHVEHTFGRL